VRKLPVIGMRDWLLIYEDTLVELSVKDAYDELEIVVVLKSPRFDIRVSERITPIVLSFYISSLCYKWSEIYGIMSSRSTSDLNYTNYLLMIVYCYFLLLSFAVSV
jgi:hypothetical protein